MNFDLTDDEEDKINVTKNCFQNIMYDVMKSEKYFHNF